MTRSDRLALLLSLIAVSVTYWVSDRIFQDIPHIEDEMAYVWQAEAIARGHLTVPSPPEYQSFLVPFVVDYNGRRFGKYPLGWPALLAIGVILGVRNLINPLLAGLGVWLTYRLGQRTFGDSVGLLAAGLTITSPFFLMNSGSLLSHPFGLVLSAAFALAWLNAFTSNGFPQDRAHSLWLPTLVAGLTLGVLVLTRPLTAVGVAVPFGLHGLYLLARKDWNTRRRVLAAGAIALILSSILYVWQYAVTGNPFLNPYTLWWPYDKVGFGPGYGVIPGGHNLVLARINTDFSLWVGYHDLFGWGAFSWIFLPFGLLATVQLLRKPRRINGRALLLGGVIISLILVYMAYWVGASLYGPRYYYEGLFSPTLFSAAGIAYLAGWPTWPEESWKSYTGWRRSRPLALTALVALLVSINLIFYTPLRVGGMYDLYGISRARLEPFLSPQAQEYTPALVIVHPKHWTGYGAFLVLEDPLLDTPFIFAHTRGPQIDAEVASHFPHRSVFYYYTDQPYIFYTAPRPEQAGG